MDRQLDEELGAIVRPSDALEHFTLARWAPDPPIDRLVDRFWKTAWDLPEPFVQTIVTYPAVNLVFQADGSATVSGVQQRNAHQRLEGEGWALGVMFRPGGFRPLVDVSMSSIVDQQIPANELFGSEMEAVAEAVVAEVYDDRQLGVIVAFLAPRFPDETTVGERLSELVETAVVDRPPVTRVAELADRCGVSMRTLQRLFAEHVGVGPKLVLDRYRVQAAAEAALAPAKSWVDVATELGYADQAHLISDFSAVFGAPPAAYARQESQSVSRQ